MKRTLTLLSALLLAQLAALAAEATNSLTQHLRTTADLGELRDLQAEWNEGVLKLSTGKAERHAWAVIPAPQGGWDLARRATVNAEITNTGDMPVGVMFWVVGDHGWSAVVDSAALAPQETRTFSCNLRATYPDGTPKLNPGDVKQVQVMLNEAVGAKGQRTPQSHHHQTRLHRSPAGDGPGRCAGMETPARPHRRARRRRRRTRARKARALSASRR